MPLARLNVKQLCCSILLLVVSFSANATNVIMQTTLGDIEIKLFDTVAPGTVANFLNYVNDGDYVDSFVHRSVPGFVIQGGGFTFKNGAVGDVPTDSPINNEFNRSNIRGTIAMAKLAGNQDSATSQWFINLTDNSASLDGSDGQGGGFFTVFGEVIGNGMDVADAIAALPRVNASGAFTELPVRDYTSGNVQQENLIFSNVVLANAPPPAEECDDDFVIQSPDELVIDVAPTGSDDTVNIQCALEKAADLGMPIVRLDRAEYNVSSIIVEEFKGSFQGTTRASSILNILDGSIDCAAMETEGLTPSAIKFVRGEPRLRFMTINADTPCISGAPLQNLIHFTGLNANDASCNNDVIFGSVDRVDIFGPGRDEGVRVAINVSPESTNLGGCKDTLLGTFKLNQSSVNDFNVGINTTMKSGAQVDVNFTTFTNNTFAILLSDSNQSATINSNSIISNNSNPANGFSGGVVVATIEGSAPSKTRVVINNNVFSFSDSVGVGGVAVGAGIFNGSIQDVSMSVTNNKFILDGNQIVGVVGADIDSAAISENNFAGFCYRGIEIEPLFASTMSDWTITANTGFPGLSTVDVDIFTGPGTRQFIVGPDQGADSFDGGSGNIILPQSISGDLTGLEQANRKTNKTYEDSSAIAELKSSLKMQFSKSADF